MVLTAAALTLPWELSRWVLSTENGGGITSSPFNIHGGSYSTLINYRHKRETTCTFHMWNDWTYVSTEICMLSTCNSTKNIILSLEFSQNFYWSQLKQARDLLQEFPKTQTLSVKYLSSESFDIFWYYSTSCYKHIILILFDSMIFSQLHAKLRSVHCPTPK